MGISGSDCGNSDFMEAECLRFLQQEFAGKGHNSEPIHKILTTSLLLTLKTLE